jgi:hypothetical protein
MKNKYFILLVLIALFAACTDKFEEFNTDVKNPAVVAGEPLFSNAQKDLIDQISSTNVNENDWKLYAQYWTETTYTDEANYDVVNRTVPDYQFRAYYRGFLRDFQEATKIISETAATSAIGEVEKSNKLAIIELMVCYSYQELVDIFGDIPYTQALDVNNISPAYDKAADIYASLITRVTAATEALDPSQGSFGGADIIYGGDVASWIKFGNSLKIKLGISIADADAGLAKSTISSGIAGAFTSHADDALVHYFSSSPNYNPIYDDLVASGRNDFVPANTIVDMMNTLSDPRRPAYFEPMADGTYLGGPYGYTSPYANYSHLSAWIHDPTFPGIFMTYDEIQFYLAEAAARGFTVPETAETYYNNGIKASFEYWGLTPEEATAYLAKPEVAYATAAGDWKQKIGTQAWLAFYTRGLVGYTEWRRLDYPIFNLAETISAYNEIPTRFTYPVNEQTLNKTSYEAASASIGGDLPTTRIFWDAQTGTDGK